MNNGRNSMNTPIRLTLTAVLSVVVIASAATAQNFPEKAVRIVVPFPPGGGNDIISRTLAEDMTKTLGQQVLVDNKPGAGTVIGTDHVAKAAPDGYTILIASFAFAVNPSFLRKLPYDHPKAFAPISLIGRSPNIVIVPPDRPFKTMQELTAHARANPGKLSYGSFGNGTSGHFAPELYKLAAKVDILHVPYKGTGAAITDLLGGRLDMMFATLSGAGSHVRNGKLRPLAVTSAKRSPAYPDLPTIAETGIAGYEAQTWYGLLAPAGTPAPVITKLHGAIKKAAESEAFKKRSAADGLVVDVGDGAALAKLISEEEARWRRVVSDAKIRPD
jgi:tripartite-type tricarboxylate transporter receptor subunit TctC